MTTHLLATIPPTPSSLALLLLGLALCGIRRAWLVVLARRMAGVGERRMGGGA
jgi:hypothetical protein